MYILQKFVLGDILPSVNQVKSVNKLGGNTAVKNSK